MHLLSEPTCTRCGSALPLRALWAFARTSDRDTPAFVWLTESGLFRAQVGVACPNCAAKFLVVQTRIRLVRALCWVLLCVIASVAGWWSRRENVAFGEVLEFAVAFIVVGGTLVVVRAFTPYLAQVRPAADEKVVSFPLYSVYERTDDEGRAGDI